ncbi:hypothetical protein D7D52_34145 [Nocardia yunnanensis]|uniref:Uncharacterized protein n=1 Tax=Nocardia yunnanensis TaxID=2382165 RepID=A0A386ZMV4_9NOCA|nr:hypothetical protein [Nocardia yunnanensis]AYF78029.1 hypothetical protein D7D52_34145 [Nocardia yunnanensis]
MNHFLDIAGAVLGVIGLFAVAVVAKVGLSMVSKEIEGRIDGLAVLLLKLARLRLPAHVRDAIYDLEWMPELQYIIQREQARPITRLWDGLRYSGSLCLKAGSIARAAAPSASLIGRLKIAFRALLSVSGGRRYREIVNDDGLHATEVRIVDPAKINVADLIDAVNKVIDEDKRKS